MRRTRFVFVAALALATLTPACRIFRKSPKVAPAPPVAPAAAPAKPPKPRELTLPATPDLQAAEPDISQTPPQLPAEEMPPPPHRRARPRTHEDAEAPAPAESAEPPAAPPLPDLEQILTPEQRQAYIADIDKNIANAQRTVALVRNRRLSRDQATYLARIRAFIDQANEARQVDLFRAKNLAERASVLADDLLKSVE